MTETGNDRNFCDFVQLEDGMVVSSDMTKLLSVPEKCQHVVVPNGIKIIGELSFFRHYELKTILIPDTVEIIEDAAFDHCHNLESISLPNELKSIGRRSFACCYSLKSINIPHRIRIIPNRAFYCCKCLENIHLGNQIVEIGYRAFYMCKALTITINSTDNTQIINLLKNYDEPEIFGVVKIQ